MQKVFGAINSDILNKSFDYVFLTADIPSEEVYVLFIHDGNDYLELGGFERTFQQLLRDKPFLASKLVFVLIHPGNPMERWHSFHHKGNFFQAFIRFMTDKFIPEIEQKLARCKRRIVKLGLLGDSLAGNISLNIAIKAPDKWTHLLLQSAAVSIEDLDVLSQVNNLEWNIYQTVGIHEDQFVSAITNEKLYILSRNRKLYEIFQHKKANVYYSEQEAYHVWSFWEKDLKKSLEFFLIS